MSIKKLVSFIGKDNIAGDLDGNVLMSLAQSVKDDYESDWLSMSDWVEGIEEGRKLRKAEYRGKTHPWQNASNYKDPLLTEASLKFGDRATLELLRSKDLISAEIVGRDAEGLKQQRCDRITEAMNYQVNHDMNDWREGQSDVLYILPTDGCVFKNVVYDAKTQKSESHIIQYPDFAVNQATKSMDKCRSFSQTLDFSRNEVEARIRSGIWLDVDLYQMPSGPDKEGDEGSNEEKGVLEAKDNQDVFIQQQCFFDLDDDGYEEPYIVTIHKASCKVVRVVARFDEESIMVELEDRIVALPEAVEELSQADKDEFGGDEFAELAGIEIPEFDTDTLTLVQINPFQAIVKYGFIRSLDGTFLDLGYSHLLSAPVQSVNATTNQLTDRGTLNNLGGGMLAKEFRDEKGIKSLSVGKWLHTNIPAEKLSKGIFPHPNQEPSPTLYNLNERMDAKGRNLMAVVDMSGQISAQTAPTTALALIQEGMISTTALFARILRAESREFQILFRINKNTFDPNKYIEILDDPNADALEDFGQAKMDIVPTANAEQSSKMQRIQVAEIQMDKVPLVAQAGGNAMPIIKDFFEAIGSTLIDQIFPEPGTMTPEEKAQMEALQRSQDLTNQIQQQQLQILAREQDRLDAKTSADIEKIAADIEKGRSEMVENLTKAMLNSEQAETEHVTNAVTVYNVGLEAKLAQLLAVGAKSNERINTSQITQGSKTGN